MGKFSQKIVFLLVLSLSTLSWNCVEAESRFFATDHLGSLSLVVDSAGKIGQQIFYSPFGEIVSLKTSGTISVTNSLYTQQEFDSEAGLSYYGTRYYDSAIGRFTSRDAMLTEPPYAYVRNNPIHLTDPDGQDPSPDPTLLVLEYEKAFIANQKATKAYLKAGRDLLEAGRDLDEVRRRLASTRAPLQGLPRPRLPEDRVKAEAAKISSQAGARFEEAAAALDKAALPLEELEQLAPKISDPTARALFDHKYRGKKFAPPDYDESRALREEEVRLLTQLPGFGSSNVPQTFEDLQLVTPSLPPISGNETFPNQEGLVDTGRFVFPPLTPAEQNLVWGTLFLLGGTAALCAINAPACGLVVLGTAATSS